MKDLSELIIQEQDVSLSKLAKEIGVSRVVLSYIINKKHEPSLPVIKKICNYFNKDFHEYI